MFFALLLFDVYCCEFVKENLPRKNFEIWGPQNQGFWGENSHEKCLGQKKAVVWFSFFTISNFWQTTPLRRRRITGRVMNRTKGKRVKPHLKSTRDIFFYTCIILICVDHTLFIIRCSSSFHFFAIFSFFILRPQLDLNVYIATLYKLGIHCFESNPICLPQCHQNIEKKSLVFQNLCSLKIWGRYPSALQEKNHCPNNWFQKLFFSSFENSFFIVQKKLPGPKLHENIRFSNNTPFV